MHGSVVLAESVQEHDFNQIPDFAADRGALGPLPGRLFGLLGEAGVRVAPVERFEPFGAVGVGSGHVGPGGVGHRDSEPVVPPAGCVVPFDFFGSDVVAAYVAGVGPLGRGWGREDAVEVGGAGGEVGGWGVLT